MTYLELPDSDSNNLPKGFVEIDYSSNDGEIKHPEYTVGINNHPGDSPPPLVFDLRLATGNRSVPLPHYYASNILSHSNCVWPRHIFVEDDDNYHLTKRAVCVGCKDIPRAEFAYECERHHTYCKHCLDDIIAKALPHHPHCIIDQHIIHKHQPFVKTDTAIRVYCPYSISGSLSKSNQGKRSGRSKSVHSKKKKKAKKTRSKSEIMNHPSDSKRRTKNKRVRGYEKPKSFDVSQTSSKLPNFDLFSKTALPMRVKEKPRTVKKTKCVWDGYLFDLETHLQTCKSQRQQTHKSSESEIFFRPQRKEYYTFIEQQICTYSPTGCSYSSSDHSEYQKHLKKNVHKHLNMIRDHHAERITHLENLMNEKLSDINSKLKSMQNEIKDKNRQIRTLKNLCKDQKNEILVGFQSYDRKINILEQKMVSILTNIHQHLTVDPILTDDSSGSSSSSQLPPFISYHDVEHQASISSAGSVHSGLEDKLPIIHEAVSNNSSSSGSHSPPDPSTWYSRQPHLQAFSNPLPVVNSHPMWSLLTHHRTENKNDINEESDSDDYYCNYSSSSSSSSSPIGIGMSVSNDIYKVKDRKIIEEQNDHINNYINEKLVKLENDKIEREEEDGNMDYNVVIGNINKGRKRSNTRPLLLHDYQPTRPKLYCNSISCGDLMLDSSNRAYNISINKHKPRFKPNAKRIIQHTNKYSYEKTDFVQIVNSEKNDEIKDDCMIIDFGSGNCKIGYSSNISPIFCERSVLGYQNHNKSTVPIIGNKIFSKKHRRHISFDVRYPVVRGRIQNFDDWNTYLNNVCTNQLAHQQSSVKLLLTDNISNTDEQRLNIAENIFENHSCFNKLLLFPSSLLSMYSYGCVNGLSINSGYGTTSIVPIIDNKIHINRKSNIYKYNIGGQDISSYLMNCLQSQLKMKEYTVENIANEVKHKFAYVKNVMNDGQLQHHHRGKSLKSAERIKRSTFRYKDAQYLLPDGTSIRINRMQRYECCELLFDKKHVGNTCKLGIHEMCKRAVFKSNISKIERKVLCNNIVLSGGNCKLDGFERRLMNELQGKLKMKCKLNHNIVGSNIQKSEVVWKGGAILCHLSSYQKMWITDDEYRENGPNIVLRKIAW